MSTLIRGASSTVGGEGEWLNVLGDHRLEIIDSTYRYRIKARMSLFLKLKTSLGD